MTLSSGHPCVIVLDSAGKQLADGDADDSDFGLRAYLTKAFNLPSDAIDEQNGSEFYILKQKFKAGDQAKASFGLYWSDLLPKQSAYFMLKGEVKIDSSDPNYPNTTYLEVKSQDIQQIPEKGDGGFLQTLKWRAI